MGGGAVCVGFMQAQNLIPGKVKLCALGKSRHNGMKLSALGGGGGVFGTLSKWLMQRMGMGAGDGAV